MRGGGGFGFRLATMSFAEPTKTSAALKLTDEVVSRIQRKTIRTLTAGQVLSGFGLGSTLSIGSLLAQDLSGSAAWAGAAATFSTLGAATWAIPLARLAYSRGRKVALASGAAIAILGANEGSPDFSLVECFVYFHLVASSNMMTPPDLIN